MNLPTEEELNTVCGDIAEEGANGADNRALMETINAHPYLARVVPSVIEMMKIVPGKRPSDAMIAAAVKTVLIAGLNCGLRIADLRVARFNTGESKPS